MSKEHYVTPEEFGKLSTHRKFYKVGFGVAIGQEIHAQIIIDSIRNLNKLDSTFKYTCVCDEQSTEWLFGYSDNSVYHMVNEKIDKMIIEIAKSFSNVELDPKYIYYKGIQNGSACSCPFDL